MQNKRIYAALALFGLVFLAACDKGAKQAAVPDVETPDGSIMMAVEALKTNDFRTFMQRSMSEAEYEEARSEWEKARAGDIDPAEQADLDRLLARLNQDNAVDEIMQELEPRLNEVRDTLPLLLFSAQTMGHAGIAANEDLSEEEKASANELLAAAGRWAGGRDLADPELARRAVSIAVEAGRELGLEEAGDMQALEFEEMLEHAGSMFKAGKDMLLVYGLGIDEMLGSVTAETVGEEGDEATVRVRFTLFDTQQKIDVPMVRRDGRWHSRHAETLQDKVSADHH